MVTKDIPDIAAGAQIVVRDEVWVVRSVRPVGQGHLRIEATGSGSSDLVRDQEAVFFSELEQYGGGIEVLDPRNVRLVADTSPGFLKTRLWLEALLRQSPTPVTTTEIVSGHRGLADPMQYQLRPAYQALSNLRPRILIGDAVGLGKTLEIGIVLTELIQRGRGDRILVVTPRAVLEQFQREMWTRYAIPLVRLDSDGIQKVRRTLPASRNPFSYYRRVIVSIDTLKNPARYRHFLKGQRWDAVVIDECHNLINRGTQNNQLARLLAEQTDALILASATPHNGKPESFAELVRLLDPTAIADPEHYEARDIEHLYVRRHRNSPDVRLEVGHRWAARKEPRILPVAPTPQEQAVLAEFRDVWLRPASGAAPVSGKGRTLFPWTLFKAFLSSPTALRSSIRRRLATLAGRSGDVPQTAEPVPAERDALTRLDGLAAAAQDAGPAKLEALVAYLRDDVGIGPRSGTRIVVFSERIDTLRWLRTELRERLGLPAKALEMLYAQLPDADIQRIRTEFELADSPIRVLLASDMASEGINLHRQCHHLVHYDLPWSFIRIQQRNGRIDRYLQEHEPEITALALTSDDPELDSDLRVVTKLLRKEHAANQALGDAGALLDLRDEQIEEETVIRYLREGRDLDQVVPEPTPAQLNPFAAMLATGGEHTDDPPVPTGPRRTLFADDDNFLAEALPEVVDDHNGLDLYRDPETDLIAFDPPEDLVEWLRDLPGSTARVRLSAQPRFAEERLAKARAGASPQARGRESALWPDVGYLAPIHPVLEWVTGRALARFKRDEVPVVTAAVDRPAFLTQATWSNGYGQPVLTHWGAIIGLPDEPEVGDLLDVLERAGLREQARNPGAAEPWLPGLQPLVSAAVDAATADLRRRREERTDRLLARLEEYRRRLDTWEQLALDLADRSSAARRRRNDVRDTRDETSELIDKLATDGEPFVRVVGVIVPSHPPDGA